MNKLIYSILAVLAFIVLVLRAIYVPVTHDEIATFYYYIQPFSFNPLTGAHPDANNHILNSLLSGIVHKFFGYSVFHIRLVNLMAFIPYAFFVFKIGQKLSTKISKWGFYLSLLFGFYFVQFFSICRGYGLSMPFLMGGIYFAFQLYYKKSLWSIVLGSISLLLAMYANMSLLPLALLLFLVIIILVLKNKEFYSDLKSIIVLGLTALVTLFFTYFAVIISFKMKNEGSLYYGELDGFWAITIKSQLLMLFENQEVWIQFALGFVLLIALVLFLVSLLKDKLISIFKSEYLFFYLLIGIVIGIILMAKVMGINYPEDRVGMYLYPLFISAVCFLADKQKSLLRFTPVLLFIMPIHFVLAFNMDHTSIWKTGYQPDRLYETVKNSTTETGYPASLGGDEQRIFVYTEKIYRDSIKPNQLQFWNKTIFDSNMNLLPESHPGKYYDYLITNSQYIRDIVHLFDSVDVSRMSGHALFKRKQPSVKQLLDSKENHLDGEINQEYFEILHQTYDSLGVDAVMIGLNLEIQSLRHPFTSRVVAEARDKETGEVYNYQYFQLDWLSNKVVSKKPWVNSLYLQNLPKFKEVEIVVYLWNINQKPYSIYKGKSEVFKVFTVDSVEALNNDFFETTTDSLKLD